MNHLLRELARFCLEHNDCFPAEVWTQQGFGFLRLRISPSVRMHVWDSRLRLPGVSDIHDHTQWAFTSHVISGEIMNIRYSVDESGDTHEMGTLTCGIGGGLHSDSVKRVGLVPGVPEIYTPGMSYRQEPDEVHRSIPTDGAVTIIEQERRDVDTARVFWTAGSTWGNAIPTTADLKIRRAVIQHALSVFGP